MTTDALTERIARVLAKQNGCDPDKHCDQWVMDWMRKSATAVLPIVEAEMRAAKAETILMDSFDMAVADRLADAGYTEYAEDEDGGVTWVSAPLGEVLHIVRTCATEYETGDQA